MKWTKWLCASLLILIAVAEVVSAAEQRDGARPYQFLNRLRLEYDDNIYQETEDETGSFKIIEEIELRVNLNLRQTFLSLRYKPSYTYWDKRESDKHDFNHDLDFVLNQEFTPRLTLSIVDTLRRGELPELEDGNVAVREDDSFYYNAASAALGFAIVPQTRLEGSARYIILRYDDATTSSNEDYDIVVAGVTLRHQFVPETVVRGDLRAEQVEYDGEDRGSQSYYAGLGLEQTFTPNFLGSVRGGYQQKEFNDAVAGSQSEPYGDVALTFLPTPATRLTAGAGYSMFEAEVYPFVSQDRMQVYASFAYDITARIAFYLSGSYTMGDYTSDNSLQNDAGTATAKGGTEDTIQVSARTTFQLNRSNWLEAGYQFTDFSSEVKNLSDVTYRASYQRNRFDIGWKTQF